MKLYRKTQISSARPSARHENKGYIKVDGVSSVFCFIWGWEEPAWGLPFQFHGVFYVMISMKGPWYASVIWAQKRSALKPTTALVRSRSLMNNSMICFIASNFNSYSQFDYDADIRSIVLFLVPCPHCSVCSRFSFKTGDLTEWKSQKNIAIK